MYINHIVYRLDKKTYFFVFDLKLRPESSIQSIENEVFY